MNFPAESVPYLKEQLRNGRLLLLTGAGFSADAEDRTGRKLPVGADLAKEIWELCYPGEAFESSSSLQDLFQMALSRHRAGLHELLQRRLTVNSATLPEHYEILLAAPWKRMYTLNIDDLAVAAARRFALPRKPLQVSGTTNPHGAGDQSSELEVIHLNGTLADAPDKVTFATDQYGRRLASQEPVYHRFVSDLASSPFVMVGTKLDESLLWQHIELRGERGVRGLKELRPRSFLVTSSLSRARRELLREYNIELVDGGAKEFAEVLKGLVPEMEAGLKKLVGSKAKKTQIELVGDLVARANPRGPSFFLLGAEPEWADILSGRAAQRSCEAALLASAQDIVRAQEAATAKEAPQIPKTLVITGTAGSGKTSLLLRMAMALSAAGKPVAWIDREAEVSPRDIRALAKRPDAHPVIAIDDADRYGNELAGLINDIQSDRKVRLLVVVMRSSKVERLLAPGRLNVAPKEFSAPPLTDEDIDGLIHVLDTDNKLGILKGLSAESRIKAFRDQAGRQLLVAMMQATSGQRFEAKILSEWEELGDIGRAVYSLVALATSLKNPLTKDEILLGVGSLGEGAESNEALNALTNLVGRHVLLQGDDGLTYRARHKRIAEVLIEELHKAGRLGSVHVRLAYVAAAKVAEALPRSSKPWRLLKAVISHEYLLRMLGIEDARSVYDAVEHMLSWDYHFLLQRGCLEVEEGDIRMAENYVGQAYSLAPDDALVATEFAYMLMKRAALSPGAPGAPEAVEEAVKILEEQIERRGSREYHPFHVLGSQAISWVRHGGLGRDEKEHFLRNVMDHMDDALRLHPSSPEIVQVHRDVKKEWLALRL